MFSIARCLLRTKYQFQSKGDYNSKVFKLFLNFKYNGLCSRAFFFVESISDLNRRVCTMGRCLIVLCLFTKFSRVRAKIYKSRSSVVHFRGDFGITFFSALWSFLGTLRRCGCPTEASIFSKSFRNHFLKNTYFDHTDNKQTFQATNPKQSNPQSSLSN